MSGITHNEWWTAMKKQLHGADSLFHIVVTISSRDEHPDARGEERIYTEFGWLAAQARFHYLRERYPGCVQEPRLMSPEHREPVC